MARVNTIINNFTGGEISPRAWRRSDLDGFFSSAEFQRNFISDTQGGLRFRPGSRFISNTPDNGAVRLLPFIFDELDTYLVEVGTRIIRFARTPGEYVNANSASIQRLEKRTDQVVLHVVTSAITGARLNTTAMCRNILEDDYQFLNRKSLFFTSGTSSLDGAWTEIVFDVPGAVTEAPFEPLQGNIDFHWKVDSPYNEEELPRLKFTQFADTMFLACGTKPLMKLQRTGSDVFVIDPFFMTDNNSSPRRTADSDVINNGYNFLGSGFTEGTGWSSSVNFSTKTAGTASGLTQAVDFKVGVTYRVRFHAQVTAGTIQARFTGGTDVLGTARDASGVYEQDLVALSGNNTFSLYADATFAGRVWGITVHELGQAPYCVELYESRLFKAHTDFEPDSVAGSQTFIFDKFDFQFTNTDGYPAAAARIDSDPVRFRLANPNSDIVHLAGTPNFLYAGTLGGGIGITGGSPGAGITATSFSTRPLHRQGSILVAPVFTKGADTFFVEFDQRKLRKLEFSFDRDRFFPLDVSLAVDHFGEGRFIRGTAKKGSDERIMLVDSLGDIACTTYDAELGQNGWYKIEAPEGFSYRDVCALPTPTQEDTVFVTMTDGDGNIYLASMYRSLPVFFLDQNGPVPQNINSRQELEAFRQNSQFSFFARFDQSFMDLGTDLSVGDRASPAFQFTFGANTGNTTLTLSFLGDGLSALDEGRKIRFVNSLTSFTATIDTVNSTSSADVTIDGVLPKLDWIGGLEVVIEFLQGEELYAGAWLANRNDVALEIDGVAYTNIEVDEFGKFEAPQDGALYRAGLPYRGLWKSINLAGGSQIGTSDSLPKNIGYVTLSFLSSSRFKIGTDYFNLEKMTFEGDSDPMDVGAPLFTGEKRVNLKEEWNGEKHVYLLKDTPGPLQVLSMVPKFNVGND